MKLGLRMPSWRLAIGALLTLGLAGVASVKAMEAVRGPLAPQWVEQLTRPNTDLVAAQFDLDMAINRRQTLPTEPCWPCRAREALKHDPMSAPALRILAMYADRERRGEDANELMNLAARLSRRESIVQFWNMQQADRRGDVEATMRHYDQAIAVRPQLGEVMFPQIAARLDEPRFRSAFAALMREDRHWMDEFILFAMSNSANLASLAATFEEASPSGPVNETTATYERGMIALLASRNDYPGAFRLARRLLGSDALLGDSSLNERTLNAEYAPLLWTFSENSELASGLTSEGTLRVEALSAASGIAVYRVFMLSPGSYQFRAEMTPVAEQPMPMSTWEAHCLDGTGAGLLGRERAGNGAQGLVRLDFTVPRGCRAVRLALVIVNEVGQDLASLDVSDVRLQRRGR